LETSHLPSLPLVADIEDGEEGGEKLLFAPEALLRAGSFRSRPL
jgi:hypothetical protein